MRFVTHSERDTEDLACAVAALLRRGDVLALEGGLGAGKTAFVRGLARGLGCPGGVSSPTFALMHRYDGGVLPLYHFDLYRLRDEEEVEDIGFLENLSEGVTAVEWPGVAGSLLPSACARVVLGIQEGEDIRSVFITGIEGVNALALPGR